MSDKNRPKDDDGNGGGGGGVGAGGRGDDDDGEERKISEGCSRRGKRVALFRLRKGKKITGERKKEKGVYVNSGFWWRRRSKIPGCFSCLKEPGTLDSSVPFVSLIAISRRMLLKNCKSLDWIFSGAEFAVLADQREPQMNCSIERWREQILLLGYEMAHWEIIGQNHQQGQT